MKHSMAAYTALLTAAALLLAGCTKSDSAPVRDTESSAAETTESTAEATESKPETTESSAPETTEQTSAPESSAAEESSTADESSAEESSRTNEDSAAPAGNGTVKVLWSERGLEAVAPDSEGGYGEELKAGDKYLDWTVNSISGTEKDVEIDLTYDGALSTNGIMTVLASTHADYPNGLYLRVDNQADFPYFPNNDQRERGKFIIENADEVYEMLELDDPPVSSEYTVAVTVAVTSLHIHCTDGGYDTIRVTSAAKR